MNPPTKGSEMTCCPSINGICQFASEAHEKRKSIVNESKGLIIHFLGAEEFECFTFSKEVLIARYNTFIEFLVSKKYSNVSMVFIGPNLLSSFDNDVSKISLMDRTLTIEFSKFACLYHDYYSIQKRCNTWMNPDIVLMLNAGIWGYNSWLPTLDIFAEYSSSKPDDENNNDGDNLKPLFIVTAYTLEEAEDDEDVIRSYFDSKLLVQYEDEVYLRSQDDICNNTTSTNDNSAERKESTCSEINKHTPLWLWEAEINPFKSQRELPRKSEGVEGRKYFENHAWQCFHF